MAEVKATYLEIRYEDGTVERAEGDAAAQAWEFISAAQTMYCLRGANYTGPQLTKIPATERTLDEERADELRMQNAGLWLRQQEHTFPDWYDAGDPVMKLLAAYAKFREGLAARGKETR